MENNRFDKMLLDEVNSINISQSERLKQTEIESQKTQTYQTESVSKSSFWKRYKFTFITSVSMILMVVICLTAILTGINKSGTQVSTLTSYIIDINPLICVTADSTSDTIVSVYSLNDDGDIILEDGELNEIIGQDLFSGVHSILKVVENNNFINSTDERTINIFAVNDSNDFAERKANNLSEDMFAYFFEKGMRNIDIHHGPMDRTYFKEKMGFDGEHVWIDENHLPPPPPPPPPTENGEFTPAPVNDGQ